MFYIIFLYSICEHRNGGKTWEKYVCKCETTEFEQDFVYGNKIEYGKSLLIGQYLWEHFMDG